MKDIEDYREKQYQDYQDSLNSDSEIQDNECELYKYINIASIELLEFQDFTDEQWEAVILVIKLAYCNGSNKIIKEYKSIK